VRCSGWRRHAECDFSIAHSVFTRNAGSGITSVASGPVSVITVTDSAFTSNSAADGGGIDVNSLNGVQLTATGDTFTGNSATAAGGAIYDSFAGVTATGDTFTGNSAPAGGGIANEGEANVTVTDSTFLRNAAASAGGAIYNQCVAVVTGTTFDQNTAGSGGGAIEQEAGCLNILSTILTLSLTSSQVLGNFAATDGGGIDNAGGTVTLTRSQVLGNFALRSGGGIYDSGAGSAALTSSLVLANRPDNCTPAGSVPGCAG
jgi:Chlamydia polymorphic membrane protein (Chlamydia_PMP) repeat